MPDTDPLPRPFAGSFAPTLPPLPFDAWTDTRKTLHLLCQIVGKLRIAMYPRQNHWWHVPLYVTPRGLTTGTLYAPSDPLLTLSIEIDLREPGGLHVATNKGASEVVTLPYDGSDCARLYRDLLDTLARVGVDVEILATPYELPWTATPFPEDEQSRGFKDRWANRYFRALSWVDRTFNEYRGDFLGKQTPSHLFWHSFDLAVTRFSGRPNPKPASEFANPRDAEAYSHEVISVGFWPGDDKYPHAAFYGYVAPEPDDLADQPLPIGEWIDAGGSHMARVDYDAIRAADDPREALLGFLRAVHAAGVRRAEWPDLMLPPASHYTV